MPGPQSSFAYAPKTVPHAFRFETPDVHVILLLAPCTGEHEGPFRDLGQPALRREIPPPPEAAPDLDRLADIVARHGTRLLGPPPNSRRPVEPGGREA